MNIQYANMQICNMQAHKYAICQYAICEHTICKYAICEYAIHACNMQICNMWIRRICLRGSSHSLRARCCIAILLMLSYLHIVMISLQVRFFTFNFVFLNFPASAKSDVPVSQWWGGQVLSRWVRFQEEQRVHQYAYLIWPLASRASKSKALFSNV